MLQHQFVDTLGVLSKLKSLLQWIGGEIIAWEPVCDDAEISIAEE